VNRWQRHHEMSILTAAAAGAGRCFGWQPPGRTKLSDEQPSATLYRELTIENLRSTSSLLMFGETKSGPINSPR